MNQSAWLNPPNLISLFRLAMAPFLFLFLYMEKYLNADGESIFFCTAAGAVFLVASLTDMLDGYVARKTGNVTDIGKFLDPLADKVLVTTALIMLVNLNRVPAWIALIIILREMVITGLRGVASTRGVVIAASHLGKKKTILQDVALTALLFHGLFDFGQGWAPEWLTYAKAGMLVLYVAVFYTLYSGYDYIKNFIGMEAEKTASEK
jgi:CDP-diacylglycerol---glycerol-3-phosphate 3-phosphatidyltransferase